MNAEHLRTLTETSLRNKFNNILQNSATQGLSAVQLFKNEDSLLVNWIRRNKSELLELGLEISDVDTSITVSW